MLISMKRIYFTRNISAYVDVPASFTPAEVTRLIQSSIRTVGLWIVNKDTTIIHRNHLLTPKVSI